MKRNFLHSLLFAAAVITLASCGDDDDGPSNYISYDGNSKGVSGNGILYLDDAPTSINGKDVYIHEFTLYNGEATSATAKLSSVDIYVSSYSKTLTAGTYTFSGNEESGKELEIVGGYIYWDLTATEFLTTTPHEVLSGTVTIAVSGTTYTIDGTGTAVKDGEAAANAKAVKIHYSGALESGD